MKFLHTGDLHIGKIVNDFSMLDDQRQILQQIVGIAKAEEVDAVVIAGDVYDRSIPSTDAVNLLDHFLTQLMEAGIRVLMISGNHDSPERVGFANKILEKQGLYIGGSLLLCRFSAEIFFFRMRSVKALSALVEKDRLVGIISHVPELRERIDHQLIVEKSNTGSNIPGVV